MRVTPDMIDVGLRPSLGRLRIISFALKTRWAAKLFGWLARINKPKAPAGILEEERTIPSAHGAHLIRTKIYRPADAEGALPLLVYLHGGGYMLGVPEMFIDGIAAMIGRRPCVVVAPDYRKSFSDPFPAGFDDCYDALLWARDHAAELGADPDRIIVGGTSAGGGMTAAVSLKARDTGDVKIAFQLPIYPMIDDRLNLSSHQLEAPVWGATSNAMGWDLYLAGLKKAGAAISSYAAPARCEDYRDLPPTITFVGSMEPFKDETEAYVANLRAADVPVSFELFEGAYHSFETFAADAPISQRAQTFLLDQWAAYMDRYCGPR